MSTSGRQIHALEGSAGHGRAARRLGRGTLALAFVVFLVLGALAGGILGYLSRGPTFAATTPTAPDHLYLTVQINPQTGWPQYSPANFTVPRGEAVVTIVDYDAPMAWDACPCVVTGTAGNVETVNGTALHDVSKANVAHTFYVQSLGIFAYSPGLSTVSFTVWFNETGTFTWVCVTPCGTNGYTGGPMSTPGYMRGTITVAGP